MAKTWTKRGERDAVDALLDRLVAGDEPLAPSAEHAALLTAARHVRAGLAVAVPLEAEARHLAAIRTLEIPAARLAPARAARRPRVRRLAVVLAAALVLPLGAAATAAAARNALPGDVLYPVKRAVEVVNLALHPSDSSKAKIHLDYAARRLAELEALLASRRAGEDVDVGAAMRAFAGHLAGAERSALGAGGDRDALLAFVRSRIAAHVARLTALRDLVPEQARDVIDRAIERATVAQERVGGGRPEEPGKPEEVPAGSEDRGGKPEDTGKPDEPGSQSGSRGRSDQAPATDPSADGPGRPEEAPGQSRAPGRDQ